MGTLAVLMTGLDWPRRIMAALILAFPLLILLGRAPADIAASVTAILFLFISVRERDFAWARQPWVIVGLAVWLYLATVNAFFSIEPERTFPTAAVWGRFLIFVAAIQCLLSLRPQLRDILLAVSGVIAVLTAADAIFQFIHGVDVFGLSRTASGRLTGPLGRPNVGYFLVFLGMPVMVAALQQGLSPALPAVRRLLWAAAGLLIFVAILLSGERVVLALGVLGLVGAAFLLIRPIKKLVWLFGGLSAVAMALIFAIPSVFRRIVEQSIRELHHFATTEYGRIWSHAWDMFQTYPMLGSGLRTFRLTCALSGADQAICDDLHPHQLYLEWLSETGLIGTLGFLVLIWLLLRHLRQTWPAWRAQPLIAGAAVATLMRLWPLASSGSFFTNWNETIFWFLFGLSLIHVAPALAEKTRDGQAPDGKEGGR